ncbi:MAG: choice-of-anchor tandem repeat GloVer-containing protein [Terriglobales bacterium]
MAPIPDSKGSVQVMKPESSIPTTKLLFAVALALLLTATPHARAQTFSVVHNFTGGGDGANPVNGFVADSEGNLYGTASSGGPSNNGVVFKINSAGAETVLHTFAGGTKDGSGPQGFLIVDSAGNFYGTTSGGGAYGSGTVFKLRVDGNTKTGRRGRPGRHNSNSETVLYSFGGPSDGANPLAGLAFDAAGNLYGTTSVGGSSGNGTVFELAPPVQGSGTWTENVLYSFGTGTDGANPVGGVTLDASGNLYGTTSAGGASGLGTVFQLTPGTPWIENKLHDFQNADDGAVPYAGLIADSSGNFYGAATEGGGNGGGTIFELSPSSGSWNFAVVYSVPGWGISGSFRNVVLDPSSGILYGTTHCDGAYNSGTVYELTPSAGVWNYNLLYNFTGAGDGQYSFSNLVLSQGNLYGTTKYGGATGNGVIFEVTP